MLLKCHECGHENQLGAIFCRDCGAKLDVEKMRPEVKDAKAKLDFVELFKNLLAIAVLGGLVVVGGLMFYPQTAAAPDLDKGQMAKADAKLQLLINKINGEFVDTDSFVFTPDEATYLYNNKLTAKAEESGAAYTFDKMSISLDPYDNIVLTAESKLFGSVPVSFQLRGTLEDEKMNFQVVGAKMGHLSMPKFLQKKIIDKFTPVIGGSIADIINATQKITIEDGDFHIKVKSLKKQ